MSAEPDGGRGYESWFLSARRPDAGRGLWIRRTVHRVAGRAPVTALWCTAFTGTTAVAVKELVPVAAPAGAAGAHEFQGSAEFGGRRHSWRLRIDAAEAALRPLRPSVLYRTPLPRTKLEVPVPDGTVHGMLDVDGDPWPIDGWAATVGHNWGTEHAERWIWVHAARLGGPVRWFDLVLAQVRVGGVRSPWLATGSARVGDALVPLGGLGRRATAEVASPGSVRVTVAVPGGRLRIEASAGGRPAIDVRYRDPSGGTRDVVHSAVVDVRTQLNRPGAPGRAGGAGFGALEVGRADPWPGRRPCALPLED